MAIIRINGTAEEVSVVQSLLNRAFIVTVDRDARDDDGRNCRTYLLAQAKPTGFVRNEQCIRFNRDDLSAWTRLLGTIRDGIATVLAGAAAVMNGKEPDDVVTDHFTWRANIEMQYIVGELEAFLNRNEGLMFVLREEGSTVVPESADEVDPFNDVYADDEEDNDPVDEG